jgi:hypothetical protein
VSDAAERRTLTRMLKQQSMGILFLDSSASLTLASE